MKPNSRLVPRLALLLGATALVFSTWAQNDQVQLTLRGSWPELPPPQYYGEAVTVVSNHAYCARTSGSGAGGQLTVLDLIDPVRPRLKGHCLYSLPSGQAGEYNTAIGVAGHYAYAVSSRWLNEEGWLQVIDISNPAAPAPVARLDLPFGLIDVEIADRYAYVAYAQPFSSSTVGGFVIIDLSDPTNPIQTGHYAATPGWHALCVRVVGGKAYLGLGKEPGRLEIVDVSDPTAPSLIGGCDTAANRVQALDVVGERAFVGDGLFGFEIYDVQDASNPVRLGATPEAQVWAVTVSGNQAYTLYNPRPSTPPRGFTVFDVSDPAAPTPLGACEAGRIGGLFSANIELAGRYAYATYGAGYLLVMDINNPAQPTLAGRYEFYLSARDVSVADGRAYVAAASFDSSVRIVDVRDPAHPVELGAYFPPDNAPVGAMHVAGTLACVTWGDAYRWELLDVSDPGQPRLLHRRATTVNNRKAKIVGNTLYLLQYSGATSSGQLQLFDVVNPSAPSLLGTCVFTNAECSPTDLDIAGQYAYVADEWSGLIIVDLSIPTAPRQITTRPGPSIAVQVVGQYAYLGRRQVWDDDTQTYYARLQILDVSNPANPVKVGAYDAASDRTLNDLFVAGSRAFLSLSANGGGTQGQIQVVNISSPSAPRLLTSAPTQGSGPGALEVADNTVYVGEDMRGLSIFSLSLPAPLKLNPPVLSGNTLTLSWNGGPGIRLQKTVGLSLPDWQDVAGSEGVSQIELPRTDSAAFFRLVKP